MGLYVLHILHLQLGHVGPDDYSTIDVRIAEVCVCGIGCFVLHFSLGHSSHHTVNLGNVAIFYFDQLTILIKLLFNRRNTEGYISMQI